MTGTTSRVAVKLLLSAAVFVEVIRPHTADLDAVLLSVVLFGR